MQPTGAHQPKVTQRQSWFRVVRTIAVSSLLVILVAWYASILPESGTDKRVLLVPIYFAPLWAPYVWIFLRLNSKAESAIKKKALALAVSWGVLALVLLSVILVLMIGSNENDWTVRALVGSFVLLQLSLVVASIKAYASMQKESEYRAILFWRGGVAGCILLVLLLVPPYLLRQNSAHPEASAVASLRIINTAHVVYANNHHDKGFATSLRDLGPSPGDDLIDATLATGKKSGYIITMVAAPPDSHGHVTHYTVVAQPQHFGKDGTRSFFTDESGEFHFTPENRAPTVKDQSL